MHPRAFPLALAAAALALASCSQGGASAHSSSRPPSTEPREHRAALSTGIDARWIELGDPAGEAVLFLHGYTDSSLSFLPTMRELARSRPELRLVAPDLRGHGGSSLPPGMECAERPERCFRPEDFAADALALLDREGIGRAHLVGHSLGTAVAQELALAHPERVLRVVLVAGSARFAGNPVGTGFLQEGLVEGPWKEALTARGLAFPRDAWSLTPLDVDPGTERWIAENWAVEPGADPAHLATIAASAARTPLGTWIGVLRALQSHDARERLGDLRAPALVLWPIQDVFFPEEPDQRDLRAALELAAERHGTPWYWKRYGRAPLHSPLAPPTDHAHNAHWATPAAVARDLAAFLREGGAPTAELSFVDGEAGRVRSEARGARVVGSGDELSPRVTAPRSPRAGS